MKRTIAIASVAGLIGSSLAVSVWAQTPSPQEPQAQAQPAPSTPERGQRRRSFEERFKRFDKNHDASISRDEWPRKAAAFDRIDANHDGVLTQDELMQRARNHHRRR
jgi:hypothetical protein